LTLSLLLLFTFFVLTLFFLTLCRILPRALAGVDGPTSVSSWRLLVQSIESFYGVGLWPLPQHPLRTCVAPLGEVLGGEVLPSHGDFHLSTCEMGVLPVDWSAIWAFALGVGFPLVSLYLDFEALEILGIDDPAAIVGKKLPSLRISYLRDLLRREREEPPTELRYRQWTAYFIFSCFLGNDKSTIPTPIVGMFRDIDALRDYDWGALTYGFYIRGCAASPVGDDQFPRLLAVHSLLGIRAFSSICSQQASIGS
jgi:hypothetical protein